jgi:hypothetical protein
MRIARFGKKVLEWSEHVHFMAWLIGQWSIIVSGAAALAVGVWAWLTDWIVKYGYLPIVLVMLLTFTLGIWMINGVIWLRRQRRPSKQRISFDYSYSLALEGIWAGLDLDNNENTLELRLQLRNTAVRPIRFEVEKLQFRIEDRFVEAIPKGAILAPGMTLTLFPHRGFNITAWNAFKERTAGSVEFSILYGHPEYGHSRRATKKVALLLFKKDQGKDVRITWTIETERDEEIS